MQTETKRSEGQSEDGSFTLEARDGARMQVAPFGAIVTKLLVPDRQGRLADVVLGLASPRDYETTNETFFGCPVGRTAGRTYPTRVEIDGAAYKLTANEGLNNLHGGFAGLQLRRWTGSFSDGPDGASVSLHTRMEDGEDGYPGTLDVYLVYTLTPDNVFRVEYRAETDRPTLFNPTHHGYFNLGGHASGHVGGHHLRLFAEAYVPTDEKMVPLGKSAPVEGTPYDFRTMHPLSDNIAPGEQGIDVAFVLKKETSEAMVPAAELWHPETGRVLRVFTNQNSMQVFTADNLHPGIAAKDGAKYGAQHAVCLETQNFANGIHLPDRPSSILRPGDVIHHRTDYAFSVRD